jgi:hypothetical protein
MMALKSSFLSPALMLISSIAHASTSQNTHLIQQRAPLAVIDINTFPSCAQPNSNNSYYGCNASNYSCPTVACPAESTSPSDSCITTDCFCNQPAPIQCGWDCSWSDWYNFEDWFNATCPDEPAVPFSSLPSCVRDCLPDQYIIYGCITLTSSCICGASETFGCATGCDTDSNNTINTWFTNLCGPYLAYVGVENVVGPGSYGDGAAATTTTGTATATSTPTPSHSGVQRVHPKPPIHWYEAWAITVICVSVLALIAGWIGYKVRWWQSHKRNQRHPVPVSALSLTSHIKNL